MLVLKGTGIHPVGNNQENFYKDLFPGNLFNFFFLDEYFNTQYQAEDQFGKVFTAASSLAIFIACLGLFGLSAFMVRQRTKEIGIRKVLGASKYSPATFQRLYQVGVPCWPYRLAHCLFQPVPMAGKLYVPY